MYAFAGNTLYVTELGELLEAREIADPFAEVERLRAEHSVPRLEGLPGFTGGLVGWFGFECVRYIEPRLARGSKPDELGTPDILLMLSEEVAVFDNLKGRLYLIVHADPREPQAWTRANRRLDELSHRLRHAGPGYPETLLPAALDESHFVSGFTREGFIAAVEKSKQYGDTLQVVPSQRLSVRSTPGRSMSTARCARESLAVHVLPRPRRHPGRRLLAGNPGRGCRTARS